ncbi:hypothetical protein DFH08DRAFT_969155 [Mycena albidolilacea]|uniref:Uncharacterized protein n=1 Tax=Mycena albidolilacea TaxID=1033008 RepID=A0AAD7EGS0_9AGAR|nr:hypothetical protein DFH08DRAFT_969155 [Mycena albidolilacea]
MHSPSSSKSSSMSPARLPPFSLAEFRALVSAALDSDAPAPPLALSLRTSTSHPALQRKKSVQNLHAAASSSRVRLMLSKLKKRAAALIVRRRRLSLPISASTSSKAAPSVDSALFRPYLPLAAQYECVSTSAPLSFTCAPGSPPPTPDSSECPCSSDASHAPPSPTASSFSATSSLSHSSRYSSADRPYSFIPASTVGDLDTGVYEDADPFAKGAVRVVHRSCEALPSTYSYHSTNNYASYAASPRVRRTGRGRRVPIAPLIRARARELDVELRELSGEAEADEFAPTQFAIGKDEEPEEQEIDDSGIFLDEEFVPARSSTPPTSSPSSAAYSPNGSASSSQRTGTAGLARAPTARTYPIAASPSRHGRTARTRARPGSPFPLSRSFSLSVSAAAAGAALQGDYVR